MAFERGEVGNLPRKRRKSKQDEWKLLIAQLNEGPAVAYVARQRLTMKFHESTTNLADSTLFLEDGFRWCHCDKTAHSGVTEWIEFCNRLLKHRAFESQYERSSGVGLKGKVHCNVNTEAQGICLDKSISYLKALWAIYLSEIDVHEEVILELSLLSISLLGLVRRCLLSVLTRPEFKVVFTEAGSIETGCVAIYCPVELILSGTIRSAPEARLGAVDLALTALRRNVLFGSCDFSFRILEAIDGLVLGALDETSDDSDPSCAFVDDACVPRLLGERALQLWAAAVRCCRESMAKIPKLKVHGGQGVGRKDGARRLVERLADDDEGLVMTLLDLTIAYSHGPSERGEAVDVAFKVDLHPRRLFYHFLELFHFDERALLDLLLSSETPFLEYLLRILRLGSNSDSGMGTVGGLWTGRFAESEATLRRLYQAAIKTHAHALFPYNPKALFYRFDSHFSSEGSDS
jgi:hypothetical protein